MKKVNKKILFVLIISLVCITALTMMQTYAADGDECRCENHEHDGKYIEVMYKDIPDGVIAQMLYNLYGIIPEGGLPAPSRGPMCWIFGHVTSSMPIGVVEHNYYPDNPRCVERKAILVFCTRDDCYWNEVTNETSKRIVCH